MSQPEIAFRLERHEALPSTEALVRDRAWSGRRLRKAPSVYVDLAMRSPRQLDRAWAARLRENHSSRKRRALMPMLDAPGGYPPCRVRCTSFISVISVMTIACVPLRSNEIPFTRTYLPTNGISFCL